MKKTLLLLGIFTSMSLFSQEKEPQQKEKVKGRFFGGLESNSQWYVNDPERDIQQPEEPVRSNNYLPLNYSYGQWSAGLQVESYIPLALLNYNPKFEKTGIGTYYANFKSEQMEATAGHFYEQFGSGLLLRTWEDRSLGINNAILGGRLFVKPINDLAVTALYGKQRTGFDVAKGEIYGFNSDLNLSGLFKMENSDLSLGFTYVGRYEKATFEDPTVKPNFEELTNCYAGRFNYNKNSFYISSEYNYKSPDAILDPQLKIMNNFVKPGSALLLNLGYAKKGIGIDATMRRMENMQFLSEREPEVYTIETNSQYYNDRIMNFIPSLTKQHHFNLANIYVYQAQAKVILDPNNGVAKAGEIGGQVDFFYEFKKNSGLGGKYGTKIALNAANWFNLKGDYVVSSTDPSYETEFLGFGEKYFSDYNIELSKKFSPSFSGSFVYINQYYNRLITGAANVIVKTDIAATELIYKFDKGRTFKFELEHMWADSDRGNWAGMMLEYIPNSKWSIYVSDMYNYGYDPEGDLIDHETDTFKIHFYNAGTSYKIGGTRIALGYGRQRGGLVCAGGVCRFVPPSTGLSLSLNTSF